MKNVLLFLGLMLIASATILGQNVRNCGMQEHMDQLLQDDNYRQQHEQMLSQIELKLKEHQGERVGVIQIPMAVHYQKLRGKNYDEACLIALAQDQIDILNEDYGGYNVDISNWTNIASSYFPGVSNAQSSIEFCLATSNHPSGYGLNEGEPAVTFNKTNGDSDGNWSGYINIFVRNIAYLGYSPLGGQGNGDGVVIDNNAFGSGSGCGAVAPGAPYNLGRTLTHELGHYLLLHHIWGPGAYNSPNCNDSDLVGDTPNQSQSYGGCPSIGASSCGSTDMHMNFMDYTNDACMYMFSAGQATRMEVFANSNLSAVIANAAVVCGGGTTPTCTDGIQNGQETGVDCGGPDCPACPPTCEDGIQNGNETGVDCGGPDCPPCGSSTCDVPTGLSSSKQKGGSELLLSWNIVSAANSYDIEFRPTGSSTWSSYSSNTNSLLITGLTRKSSYEWRVRSVCSDGMSDWSSITTALTRESVNGDEIRLSPNPVSNVLLLSLGDLDVDSGEIQYKIIDLTGKTIHSAVADSFGSSTVDVSNLSQGTYILTLKMDSQVVVKRFTVMK
jgi:hypothetical protein